ncbi:MAG TPA: DUF4058 family protein [Gemmataceae bacterium]|nr:DUF4058 family protein [Gemmataceae bacterium]
MPNPFPGMDPYLEGDLWTSVHTDLCVQIAHQLAPRLRPKYIALSTRRVVLATPEGEEPRNGARIPDVGVLSHQEPPNVAPGAVATAPLILSAALPEAVPHVSVQIRDIARRRLITCIEVLSPTNKYGTGRDEYEAKRLEVLSGGAHLFEIDLLRAGARFPTNDPLPPVPYFVFISRAGSPSKVAVWPILLEQPLPTIPVPLLPDDPDVPLDLQAALSAEYDVIGYDELVDYTQPPLGPLTPAQAAWIEERLRSAGRRR